MCYKQMESFVLKERISKMLSCLGRPVVEVSWSPPTPGTCEAGTERREGGHHMSTRVPNTRRDLLTDPYSHRKLRGELLLSLQIKTEDTFLCQRVDKARWLPRAE